MLQSTVSGKGRMCGENPCGVDGVVTVRKSDVIFPCVSTHVKFSLNCVKVN